VTEAKVTTSDGFPRSVSEWEYYQETSFGGFPTFTIPATLSTMEYTHRDITYTGTVNRFTHLRSKNYTLLRVCGRLTNGTSFTLNNRTNTRRPRRIVRRARKRKLR
jgi:hypothetical protein